MKASELRIGNYIIYPDETGLIWELKSINKHSCKANLPNQSNSATFMIEKIKPIPLTEEWLIKFGLKFNNEGAEWKGFVNLKSPNILINLDCIKIWSGLGSPEEYGFIVEIKYVHQLQNLYFALTGKELQIK